MQCINENSREYQTLKKQSGLSDFVLSAYVGDFLETHDRFPYLDELPKADSSKAISEDLSLNKDNTTKTENILQATNTNTVEEAVLVLNDKYRDKEIEILEVGNKSKVYITTRPNTTQNQDGETDKQIKIVTEMADIKERAIADGTFMLAPNGRQTHLTEQQWLQVRTQEFKDWFGDWENDPANASKVVDENGEPLVVYHGSSAIIEKFDKNKNTKGYWETPNGERIPYDTENTFFFTDNKASARAYPLMRQMTGAMISNTGIRHINDLQNAKRAANRITEDLVVDPKYAETIRKALDTYLYKADEFRNKTRKLGTLTIHKGKIAFRDYGINGYEYKDVPVEYINDAISAINIALDSELAYYNKDREDWDGNKIPKIDLNKDIYPVFLNLRNPFTFDYEGKSTNGKYKDKYPIQYINARQVKKALENGNDGVLYLNIADPYLMDSYGVFNSNQIKSAVDNSGQFSSSNDNINDDYENVNSFAFFNEIIDKLQTLYGINIIPITNAELSRDKWASITGTKGVKSFIYNGNIYINTDIATVDSPVHEFLHLLFGSMKYQNRALYDQLVGQAEQLDSYKTISKNYPDRTRGDINEEVFVTELAKYLTGQNNSISNLDQSIQNEIIYNVNRTLDTVLMGENSVKCIENPYIMNLKTLAKLVNSSTMISEKRGSLSDATLNRMMANTKSELMKNKELREECQ